jgi:hypothetical protein
MPTIWIIQRNLEKESHTFQQLTTACEAENRPMIDMTVAPLSDAMYALPEIAFPFVFYGYTTLILNAYKSEKWRQGIFFAVSSYGCCQRLRAARGARVRRARGGIMVACPCIRDGCCPDTG